MFRDSPNSDKDSDYQNSSKKKDLYPNRFNSIVNVDVEKEEYKLHHNFESNAGWHNSNWPSIPSDNLQKELFSWNTKNSKSIKDIKINNPINSNQSTDITDTDDTNETNKCNHVIQEIKHKNFTFKYGSIMIKQKISDLTCGSKVWQGGNILANYLISCFNRIYENNLLESDRIFNKDLNFIDLGSGTGVAGIALASLAHFTRSKMTGYLTDLQDMQELIKENINLNEDNLMCDLKIEFKLLDWNHKNQNIEFNKFNLFIAADVLYNHYGVSMQFIDTVNRIVPINAILLLVYCIRQDADYVYVNKLIESEMWECYHIRNDLLDGNESKLNNVTQFGIVYLKKLI